ncbi:hypothetical protein L6R53_15310 [Myxococcota bacterium]|nr:hypothetical protein [Myxococcota bacterium]
MNFYSEPRYGDVSTIVKDCNALSADVLRHPGRLQLFLDQIFPVRTVGDSERGVVGIIEPEHVTQSALDAAVAGCEAITNLEALIRHMQATGSDQQLFITLLTLGGEVSGWGSSLTDGVEAPTYSDSLGRTHRNPRPVVWSTSFLGTSITNELVTGESHPFELDGSSAVWSLYTFDPFNPFKRVVYARVGRALGKWLDSKRKELELDRYLAGFEVCNEVEDSHSLAKTELGKVKPDGDSWGRLFFDVARAVQHEADWVPMWLPAIASYTDESSTGEWGDKKLFLDDVVAAVVEECSAAGLDPNEMVAGVDYHHYHRKVEDARALLSLPLELVELREILDEGGLGEARLTVIESGINTVCTDERVAFPGPRPAYPGGCDAEQRWWVESRSEYTAPDTSTNPPDYRPPLYGWIEDHPVRLADAAGPNDFQGASVWMRLALAAAQVPEVDGTSNEEVLRGGADVVGWHTPLGNLEARFAGCGLRMDFTVSDNPASFAWPRPSWFAYQRFSRVLGSARQAVLRWPQNMHDVLVDTLLDELVKRGKSSQVCVVEFQDARLPTGRVRGANETFSSSPSWWALLLFIDPSLQTLSERLGCATVRLRAAESSPFVVLNVPTGPSGATWPVSRGGSSYPYSTWKTDPITPVRSHPVEAGGTEWGVRVALGAWPKLVLSSSRLVVAGVDSDLLVG